MAVVGSKKNGLIATEARTIARYAIPRPIGHPNTNAPDLIFAGTYGLGMF